MNLELYVFYEEETVKNRDMENFYELDHWTDYLWVRVYFVASYFQICDF